MIVRDLLPADLPVASVLLSQLGYVFERPALEKPCEAVVQAIVVDAGSRGSGVGAALMADAEAWARARGLASVVLYTSIGRKPAHAFYEGIGYTKTGTSHLMRRDL